MQVAEARKRSSTSGADTIVNATLGLYTIERDAKNAGYGMTTVRNSIGCEIRAQHGGDNRDFTLVPVRITDGAAGAPDQVQFMASNKNGVTLPVRISVNHPKTATNFFVESDLGVQEGDMMIAVPSDMNTAPPTWCSVFQVTGTGGASGGGGGGGNGNAQGQNQVLHNSGQSEWNQPGNSIFPVGGYVADDYVINLGSFLDHTYSINDGFLRLTDYKMVTDTFDRRDLYPNVVQLQAVYGKDTTVPMDNNVDEWNATAPATPDAWRQVIAIRVALVARSLSPEPGVVTLDGNAAASTCNSATPHPAAVCWRPDPNGNGVTIDVGSTPDWQRYRFRVLETTVPLRNTIWQQ
jgi:type IV pilus assembly protein PilW